MLLERVRRAAPPALFARGAQYAREGGVSVLAADRYVVRIAGRTDGIEVWCDGTDWDCGCGAEVAACAHVAAVAVALGESLLSQRKAPAGLRYHFRRDPTGLVLDREVPDGAPRRPEDHELNRIFTGWWGRPNAPRGLVQATLGGLRGLDVTLDGEPIRCDPAPVLPIAIVVDDQENWRVRLVRRPGIDEAFSNGLLRMGDTLRPIGESNLDLGLKQRLINGLVFAPKEAGKLVTEFLPELRKLVEVEVRSPRLPVPRKDPPRLAWDVSADGPRLSATARIVYGDPPYARVEHGELRRLDAKIVATRDLDAERRLLEAGVPVGVAVEREGAAAVQWVAALPAVARDAVLARAPNFRLVRGQGDPQLYVEQDGETFRVRGSDVDPHALVEAWRSRQPLVPLLEGGFRAVPQAWLDAHASVLAELLDAQDEGGGKLGRAQLPVLAEAVEELGLEPPPGLASVRALAGDFTAIPAAALPAAFVGQLRPYQQRGVDWIHWLRSVGMGGILADDMGLGKTVQCLAALGPGPHLVVAPTSVLGNWCNEAARFRPDLRVCLFHGPRRELDRAADVVVTSWAVLRLDNERLRAVPWATAIFDEAQAIKNADSQTAEAARQITAGLRLAVSGTPIENRLEELWSAMHLANPGLLGTMRSFRDRFSGPIGDGSLRARDGLRTRIRPFVLRRRKAEVAPELPQRTDVLLRCTLSERERTLYDAVRSLSVQDAQKLLAGGKGWLQVLEVLLRMRQAACHPGLLPGGDKANGSAKLDLLVETLDEVVGDGHRVLIFSQWTSMLDLVEPVLRSRDWGFCRLDGSTRDRNAEIARFSSPDGPPIFLLSLKAGGTGLNLTSADYVIHLDPWWNPAVEDQATDRAHRIGQTRPVVSMRLVAENTVEERILALQEKKRELVRAALDEDALARALSADELLALFA